jgi:glycosyltransferase involved in cell wall biosynthesis
VILGINASRARSGGGIAHLAGILHAADPTEFGIREVHVWSYDRLLCALPDAPWLIKHRPPQLEHSLLRQLWWERFSMPDELAEVNCAMLLNVDAGSVCRFRPAVTMSRDMLSYEPGEIERFGFSLQRFRLFVLRYVQNASLNASDGAIFLTRYAASVIQKSTGMLKNVAYIPHGVGDAFKAIEPGNGWPGDETRPIRCLYVSNALLYKHQWKVVEAIALLRQRGISINLELVGGGTGKAQARLDAQIAESDPAHEFVIQREFVPQHTLPEILAEADVFVFASSCENMPNTLVEAMAAGRVIACSDRGPMPEILEDGGVYFDPEDADSIANAIDSLISDPDRCRQLAARAKELSDKYSWKSCAGETYSFIARVAGQAEVSGSP